MVKISSQKKIGIMLIITVLIFGCAIFIHIYLTNEGERLSQLKDEVELADSENIIQQKTLLNSLSNEVDTITSYYVDEDRIPEFLDSLDAYGTQAGATVLIERIDVTEVLVNPNLNTSPKSHTKINLNLNVTGSWNSVLQFLVLVENGPKKLDIGSFELNVGQKEGQTLWNMKLGLTAIAQ